MRGPDQSKSVLRWQERFTQEGVEGLLRDKTHAPGRQPLGPELFERVIVLTVVKPPGEDTHWAVPIASAFEISRVD